MKTPAHPKSRAGFLAWLGLLLLSLAPAVEAAPRTSPSYAQPAEALGSAGRRAKSAAYTQEAGDLNMLGAPMSSAAYNSGSGFIPSGVNTYTLSYLAGNHGTISGTTPQFVDAGTSGTQVTAMADAQYHFVSWSDGVLTAARTDTNVNAHLSVTANFAIDTFTLTYNAAAGGTITGTTPQTVNYGASGTAVTATADVGYHFTSWSDGVLTATRTDSNVTADKTVTASFAINSYTLTYSAGPNGTITGITPQTVNHGASGTAVTAVANSGYSFASWSDGVTTAARTDSNVTANLSVTATFVNNSSGPGLAGKYVALLNGPNGYSMLSVTLTSANKLYGALRRPDNTRITVPTTVVSASNLATLPLSDGSALTLNFDGLGRLVVSGSLSGSGDLATTSPAPGLPGKYSAILEADDGALGWLTLKVSARGTVGVAGNLPDGTGVGTGAGTTIERDGDVLILGISSAAGRPQIAGKITFANLPTSDIAGTMTWRNGAGVSQSCAFSGAKVGPGASGLPLVIDGAGISISRTVSLLSPTVFTSPVTGLAYAPTTGIFRLSFRASLPRGTTVRSSGVW